MSIGIGIMTDNPSSPSSSSSAAATPPDRTPNIYIWVWVPVGAALVTSTMRIAYRKSKKYFGLEDLLLIITMILYVATCACTTVSAAAGGTRHIWDLRALGNEAVGRASLYSRLSQFFGLLALGTGRVSISTLLLKILEATDLRWQKAHIWAVVIFVCGLSNAAAAVVGLALCRPFDALWNHDIGGGCLGLDFVLGWSRYVAAVNIVADVSLALIPATIFFSLGSGVRERFALSFVFAANILTSACAAAKFAFIPTLVLGADVTWNSYRLSIFSLLEVFLLVFCGTLPTIYPLFRSLRGAVVSAATGASSRKGAGQQQQNPSGEGAQGGRDSAAPAPGSVAGDISLSRGVFHGRRFEQLKNDSELGLSLANKDTRSDDSTTHGDDDNDEDDGWNTADARSYASTTPNDERIAVDTRQAP